MTTLSEIEGPRPQKPGAKEHPEIITRKKPPELSPNYRQELAKKYRQAANKLAVRAKNNPSLCQPWVNEEGEKCPPPITLAPQLRRLANQLEAK